MKVVSPSTTARLEKLIPLLGSDKDGEAVAAARAIERTLKAAGKDLHDLAACVQAPSSGVVYREVPYATPDYNYADAFRRARPPVSLNEHADAITRSFGLPIFTETRLVSWQEVARHCLTLNRAILKRHGGRFLRPFETQILKEIAKGKRYPTNAHATWMETVVARCHQARAAAREAGVSI